MTEEKKGCIIMLHGYKQSESIFYKKTSGLRKYLEKQCNYEILYPCGELKVEAHQAGDHTGVEDQPDTVSMYSWFFRDNVSGVSKASNERTILPFLDYIQENITSKDKKIVGIIGFSQGAGFASLIVEYYSHLKVFENLNFAIMFSGFFLDKDSIMKDSGKENVEIKTREDSISTLHVMGTLDTVVEEWKTLKLFEYCEKKYGSENTLLLKHLGGHYVPNNKAFLAKVAAWIQETETDVKEVEEKIIKKDNKNKEIPDLDEDLLKSIENLGF
ncbi:hypothetical protein QEN19_003089 [Hanseniaspora menglaensis]